MTNKYYRIDPEGLEPKIIDKLTGGVLEKRVLEVGCGNGRLTWRYASKAEKVLAIDPNAARIEAANRDNIFSHVAFEAVDLFDLVPPHPVDLVIMAWSL